MGSTAPGCRHAAKAFDAALGAIDARKCQVYGKGSPTLPSSVQFSSIHKGFSADPVRAYVCDGRHLGWSMACQSEALRHPNVLILV
jgi:hypothetical protein